MDSRCQKARRSCRFTRYVVADATCQPASAGHTRRRWWVQKSQAPHFSIADSSDGCSPWATPEQLPWVTHPEWIGPHRGLLDSNRPRHTRGFLASQATDPCTPQPISASVQSSREGQFHTELQRAASTNEVRTLPRMPGCYARFQRIILDGDCDATAVVSGVLFFSFPGLEVMGRSRGRSGFARCRGIGHERPSRTNARGI